VNAAMLPSPAPNAQPSPAAGTSPMWVLLATESKVRGFRNALSFRRWCRSRGVRVRKDGKLLWVKRADVDATIEAVGAPPPPADAGPGGSAVDAAVAALTGLAR